MLPVDRVIQLCRDRAVLCAIDGAHAPGMLPLNLSTLLPDFYVGNLHKWCCAPKGSAFLYGADVHLGRLRPTSISHGYEIDVSQQNMSALFDWPGTHDPTAWFSVPTALDFLESIHPQGIAALRQESVAIRREAEALIAQVLPKLSNQSQRMGWMTTFRLPDAVHPPLTALEIDPFQRTLNGRHKIQIPVTCWPAYPKRVIRFSVAPYNVLDDYRHLHEALQQTLEGTDAGD